MPVDHPEIWAALVFLLLGYIELRIRFGRKLDRLQDSVQDIRDVIVIRKSARLKRRDAGI